MAPILPPTCPLCGSKVARVVVKTDKLLVCACDACNAHFSTNRPPSRPETKRTRKPAARKGAT